MTLTRSIPNLRLIVLSVILATTGSALHAQGPVRKFLNGDAKVTMINSYKGSDELPKPTHFIIRDFDVPNNVITLDKSLAQRAASHGLVAHIKGDVGKDDSQASVAADVNAAFSRKLRSELEKNSSTVSTVPAGAGVDAYVGTIVVRGSFTTVKLGSKSKRVIVGFGLGASDVKAHVSVFLDTKDGPVLLAEFDLNARSGKRPGAVASVDPALLPVGAAASDIGDRNATVEGDASRMGKAVAKEIKTILSSGQWVTPAKETPQGDSLEASLSPSSNVH